MKNEFLNLESDFTDAKAKLELLDIAIDGLTYTRRMVDKEDKEFVYGGMQTLIFDIKQAIDQYFETLKRESSKTGKCCREIGAN